MERRWESLGVEDVDPEFWQRVLKAWRRRCRREGRPHVEPVGSVVHKEQVGADRTLLVIVRGADMELARYRVRHGKLFFLRRSSGSRVSTP
jgi:hypothetical protein